MKLQHGIATALLFGCTVHELNPLVALATALLGEVTPPNDALTVVQNASLYCVHV